MKGVQCYELFGGIALKIHTFSFSLFCMFYVLVQAEIGDEHGEAEEGAYF